MKVVGRLVGANGSARTGYQKHRVELLRSARGATELAVARDVAEATESGEFGFELGDDSADRPSWQMIVRPPAGGVLATFLSDEPVPEPVLRVDPELAEAFSVVANTESERLRGTVVRVVDVTGRQKTAGIQVTLFCRTADEGPDQVLGSAVTGHGGYAVLPRPLYPMVRAWAMLGVGEGLTLDIALETRQAVAPREPQAWSRTRAYAAAVFERILPARIYLLLPQGVRVPEATKGGDCGCTETTAEWVGVELDEGEPSASRLERPVDGCVTFDTPNRETNQFTFYSIVRTTDPDVTTGMAASAPQPIAVAKMVAPFVPRFKVDVSALEAAIPAAKPAVATNADTLTTDPAPAAEPPLQITVFQHANYVGASQSFGVGRHDAGAFVSVKNDTVSSIRVPAGLRATLFQHAGFTGRSYVVEADNPALVDFNDICSGIVVESTTTGTLTAAELGAISDRLRARSNPLTEKVAAAVPGMHEELEQMLEESAELTRPTRALLRAGIPRAPGRSLVTEATPIDWDDAPTTHQATTISHGHLLEFRATTRSDGYSLGDLLYSLPLAPGQKKYVSILDWQRRDAFTREEETESADGISGMLSRDRDIFETMTAFAGERIRANSKSKAWSASAGIGGAFGSFLFGVTGGASGASSSASSDAEKNMAANDLQQLQDEIVQSASSVRNQRTTVVMSSDQAERSRTESTVVANHNHCHAMTVQYFEVLRHVAMTQEIVGVRECLFIPLSMAPFTAERALRWKAQLRRALLRGDEPQGDTISLDYCFTALERLADPLTEYPPPLGKQAITDLRGELTLRLELRPPADSDTGEFDGAKWAVLTEKWGISGAQNIWATYGPKRVQFWEDGVLLEPELKDWVPVGPRRLVDGRKIQIQDVVAPESVRTARFREAVGATVTDTLVNALFMTIGGHTGARFTLLRPYSPDTGRIRVGVRWQNPPAGITRAHTEGMVLPIGLPAGFALPPTCDIVVESAQFSYGTDLDQGTLVRAVRLDHSLRGVVEVDCTAVTAREKQDPRKLDELLERRLLQHLNNHLEYYHRQIWLQMDANRRYMLLDGFIAPNSGGRSVASVVENRLIGIVGNSLVMPVAPGYQLDPTPKYAGYLLRGGNLKDLYNPIRPVPPRRLSFPTKGVFAEAVMGRCNSCEKIDDSRAWRWDTATTDEPAALAPPVYPSPAPMPGNLSPTAFPAPIINMQNAPAAPDPAGIGAILAAISKPDIFRDLTGLQGTQANAAAALQSAFDGARFFGGEAAKLQAARDARESVDRNVSRILSAPGLSPDQRSQLVNAALRGAVGLPPEASAAAPEQERRRERDAVVNEAVGRVSAAPTGKVKFTEPGGEGVDLEWSGGAPAAPDRPVPEAAPAGPGARGALPDGGSVGEFAGALENTYARVAGDAGSPTDLDEQSYTKIVDHCTFLNKLASRLSKGRAIPEQPATRLWYTPNREPGEDVGPYPIEAAANPAGDLSLDMFKRIDAKWQEILVTPGTDPLALLRRIDEVIVDTEIIIENMKERVGGAWSQWLVAHVQDPLKKLVYQQTDRLIAGKVLDYRDAFSDDDIQNLNRIVAMAPHHIKVLDLMLRVYQQGRSHDADWGDVDKLPESLWAELKGPFEVAGIDVSKLSTVESVHGFAVNGLTCAMAIAKAADPAARKAILDDFASKNGWRIARGTVTVFQHVVQITGASMTVAFTGMSLVAKLSKSQALADVAAKLSKSAELFKKVLSYPAKIFGLLDSVYRVFTAKSIGEAARALWDAAPTLIELFTRAAALEITLIFEWGKLMFDLIDELAESVYLRAAGDYSAFLGRLKFASQEMVTRTDEPVWVPDYRGVLQDSKGLEELVFLVKATEALIAEFPEASATPPLEYHSRIEATPDDVVHLRDVVWSYLRGRQLYYHRNLSLLIQDLQRKDASDPRSLAGWGPEIEGLFANFFGQRDTSVTGTLNAASSFVHARNNILLIEKAELSIGAMVHRVKRYP